MPIRDFSPILNSPALNDPPADRQAQLQLACDLVWDHFGLHKPARPAYSWIGFYEIAPARDSMTLIARRDKPACSPLGMHGMCGRCWTARRPLLIADCTKASGGYIACDPKDRGEVVIPLFMPTGECWGVFDADSYEADAFDDADVLGLTTLVERLGISTPPRNPEPTLRL